MIANARLNIRWRITKPIELLVRQWTGSYRPYWPWESILRPCASPSQVTSFFTTTENFIESRRFLLRMYAGGSRNPRSQARISEEIQPTDYGYG